MVLVCHIRKLRITLPLNMYTLRLYEEVCQKCRCCTNPSSSFVQLNTCIKSNQGKTYKDLLREITNLNEEVIKISEAATSTTLKVEPLNVESNMEIKENFDTERLMPSNDESQENSDLLQNSNTDDQCSDNGEESSRKELIEDIDRDLSNKSIARCCDICHKIYRNEKFLKIHERYTHMPEENKLPCPLCSYKASRTSALKVHMGLVHGHDKVNEYFKPVLDTDKKHPCNLCSRSYARKDSLQKHIRRMHLNKSSKEDAIKKEKKLKPKEKGRFLCMYCGQSFSSKSGLESHALTHTGQRPFSCDICSKTFKRLKDLQLHRVIHSDEKPHQCLVCGKAFKRADKLKIHMRVHSKLRPYKCNECDKTFKYASVLRTHMHIHTGQTPFSCKICGEAFSLRTSLNNHCLKNDHAK